MGGGMRNQEVDNEAVNLLTSRYIRVKRFSELTGWSTQAVYCKISEGVWLEGKEYRRSPDGNTLIDLEGYNRWVRGERVVA